MGELEEKMLPIGIENFEEIRKENYYYVDKTSMIRDFLLRRGKVNLFTRPRRRAKCISDVGRGANGKSADFVPASREAFWQKNHNFD